MKALLFLLIAIAGFAANATKPTSITAGKNSRVESTDTLPHVFDSPHSDKIKDCLLAEAQKAFYAYPLPKTKASWNIYRDKLRQKIAQKASVTINHSLPLNVTITGSHQYPGYTVKNIVFQTRPKVYATANLYIPNGAGPFPAVITMHGHWVGGRLYKDFKAIGQVLALNGYVCLTIDAWGAGERTTVDGTFDYHGANLGSSILNIGETLMGGQISDNIRGVDLLCSLPYVDASKLGATGASGGGNQTMWLSAMDNRVKAAIPVVSVGTFQSYIMGRNCICETLVDGLTFTEESGVLALLAPRALKLFNSNLDNAAFAVTEMKRSYENALPVFSLYHPDDKLSYQTFDIPHSYGYPMRQAMVQWFNTNLKGVKSTELVKGLDADTLLNEQLLVYPIGHRDPKVENIATYCRNKGKVLRAAMLRAKPANIQLKKAQLAAVLRIRQKCALTKVNTYTEINGWNRVSLETTDGKLIPVLYRAPLNHLHHYAIVSNPKGKNAIPIALLSQLKSSGDGIAVVDLLGTGESSSPLADKMDVYLPRFHTLLRSELWLGKTVIGEWVKELNVVNHFLRSACGAKQITIDGTGETALAGLFYATVVGHTNHVVLHDAPISYLFDQQETLNNFSMAIHLPGFLPWGDVSLAAALSNADVVFVHPVTMSGRQLEQQQLDSCKAEYKTMALKYGMSSRTRFINN